MSSSSLVSVAEAAGFPAKMKFRHMEFVLILNSLMWLHKSCCTKVSFTFPACRAEHLMSAFGAMKTKQCLVNLGEDISILRTKQTKQRKFVVLFIYVPFSNPYFLLA